MNLKEEIKSFAYGIGADLVGFGDIGRCRHAPVMMSPQGVFPGAKSVVVMAIRHPDACIELGGESHPQEIGAYSVQYLMNSRLDELSYRLATFLEDKGYGAIPICASNIWRYNSYKELTAIFAPDISNIYMPVVAGLADMGYNGLAMTPEYGARNRFVTVITDLEVEPDPLIPPGTICDRCMLCRKHCPSQALSKEIAGDKILKIGDYEYRFADKNLWRCAWGEHFDLDLDLEIPEKVDEKVILEQVKLHGRRGGEMGQCLKFCLPKHRRSFDRTYSKTPMRKAPMLLDEELESRAVADRLLADCHAAGIEHVVVQSAATLTAAGIDPGRMLPGAESAVTLIRRLPADAAGARAEYAKEAFRFGATYQIDSVCYDLTRELESLGFRSLMTIERSGSHSTRMADEPVNLQIARLIFGADAANWQCNTVYTRKRLPERPFRLESRTGDLRITDRFRHTETLTGELKRFARALGADLVGVAPAARIEELARQLRPHFDGFKYFNAVDRAVPGMPYDPEITEVVRQLYTADDYLPGARSVLVIALRQHARVAEFATRPPAEAAGPYAFQTYVTRWQGVTMASRLAGRLNELGFRAAVTPDLMGSGSLVASPRGFMEDGFANRFEAVAAGLAGLGRSGRAVTPEFGVRQRFIAIVTDAELAPDVVLDFVPEKCAGCGDRCVAACPTAALGAKEIAFACEGKKFSFLALDRNRCDWAKRYAIVGCEGFGFLGSPLDELPPPEITAEALAAALRYHDPIKKARNLACDPCVLACPYAAPQ